MGSYYGDPQDELYCSECGDVVLESYPCACEDIMADYNEAERAEAQRESIADRTMALAMNEVGW